jgi:stearoyl-CoA desaturase (delta-9 desaturase)
VLAKFMQAAGLKTNSYFQFQKYGSLVTPMNFLLNYGFNWLFWYGTFYLLGGHALATCLFGSVGVWAFGVRTFNFDGHGRGKDKRQEGIDFFKKDRSINQLWPGYVAGEWHNNHHLYPNGARSGFLPYQLDLPWIFIYSCFKLGIVTHYHDPKPRFFKEQYDPYLKNRQQLEGDIATS